MNSYTQLKESRKFYFDKLAAKLNAMAKGGTTFYNENNDERFWKPTLDKAGNGYAVIRLLPPPAGEDDAVVFKWHHSFEGPGGWYIENSLTTLDKDDPVGQMNKKLWAEGEDSEGRRFVSGDNTVKPSKPGSKRKLSYYANVYVVEDPAKRENNGKVFLWKFGTKLFKKIDEASNPKFPDVVAFDSFSLEEGANLKLKVRMDSYGPNYEASEWDLVDKDGIKHPRGALLPDEKLLEKIWGSTHSLKAIVAPEKFKSYNQLKQRLIQVMNMDAPPEFKAVSPPWETEKSGTVPEAVDAEGFDGSLQETAEAEDDLSYFKNLRDRD